jgi:hypothetical protein
MVAEPIPAIRNRVAMAGLTPEVARTKPFAPCGFVSGECRR